MTLSRLRTRFLQIFFAIVIGVASLCAIGSHMAQKRNTLVKERSLPPAVPLGQVVGHVTHYDAYRDEITVDFGRAKGAESGIKFQISRIISTSKNQPDAGADYQDLGKFEIVRLDEGQSFLKRVSRPQSFRPEEWPEIRPGDDAYNATDPVARRNEKLAADPDAIGELARIRLESARRWVEVIEIYYESGFITADRVVGSSHNLMEAEIEVAERQIEQIAAIEGHLKRIEWLIDRLNVPSMGQDAGGITDVVMREVRTHHAEAALMLAKARKGILPKR